MQRRVRPEFSVSTLQDPLEIAERERAKRLALFLSVVWEQPDVSRSFISKFARIEDILSQSGHPEVVQYGLTPDDKDNYPYQVRATYATGELLRHDDDLEADTDTETAEVIRATLEDAKRKNPDVNARLLRLGTLAGQISLYDTLGTQPPYHDFSEASGPGGILYERELPDFDVA